MPKNLWQKERSNLFRDLVKQYSQEGYTQKESKKFAKKEIDEIMEDKEDFVVLSVGQVKRRFNMKMDTRIVLVVKQDLEKI